MKAAVLVLALVEIGTGTPTGQRVTLQDLTERPRDYLGKKIILQDIGCVDEPKGGFLCASTVGGQALRITAFSLGPKTALPIAERLIGTCRGSANLTRPTCRVDIEIEPTSGVRDTLETAKGTMPVTEIVAPQVDMYLPAKGRR